MEITLEVIVPVHNIKDRGENLIKLLSVDSRTDTRFIVVSDSKNDQDHYDIKKIVSGSCNSDSKIVAGDYGSPGLARNAGLSVANARWVSFLDSDDEINLEALKALILNAEKNSAQLGIGGLICATLGMPMNQNYFMNPNISVLENLSLTPAFTRMIFQRDLISRIHFLDILMAEDQCFIIDVLNCDPKIYLEAVYFYTYNLGANSQSTRNLKALKDLPLAIAYIASQLETYRPVIQQVAITMILRQLATYLLLIGPFPLNKLFFMIQILTRISFRHPIKTRRSLSLILMHRPRSFR